MLFNKHFWYVMLGDLLSGLTVFVHDCLRPDINIEGKLVIR